MVFEKKDYNGFIHRNFVTIESDKINLQNF
jgi:hypothetical protein